MECKGETGRNPTVSLSEPELAMPVTNVERDTEAGLKAGQE